MSGPGPAEARPRLPLTLLPEPLALCRLPADAPVPGWTVDARQFLTLSRTPSELSITADESAVPPEVPAQRGYRALRVDGPLPLDLVGIFASMAGPLAEHRIAIFPIATYETDYVLLRPDDVEQAIGVLVAAGHRVRR